MNSDVIQIRISKELKEQSIVVAENLGFTTSTLIKLFLAHVVATREIPFIIKEIPNAVTSQILAKAENEIRSGNISSTHRLETPEESISFLKKIIQSPKDANSRLSKKLHQRLKKSSRKNSRASTRSTKNLSEDPIIAAS